MIRRALALAALAATPAQASVFDAFGYGARASAMGNAQAAIAEDYTGVYYNPATLTVRKTPHVGTGVELIAPDFTIHHSQAPGDDTPSDVLPDPNVGVNVGLLFPLGGLIENRFALGIGAFLPTVNVTRVDAIDAETPQYYRYQSLPDKLIIAPAVAFQIVDSVSVGLGVQVLGNLHGAAVVDLDALTRRFVRKNLKVDVELTKGWTAGLLVRPSPALRVGLSYRQSLALDYRLITDIGIEGAGRLVADIRGTALYTPDQYTLAVGFDPVRNVTLTTDLIWARWSQAPDPTAHFDVTLDGKPLGIDPITADSDRVHLGAVDTLSPHVGVEWRPDPAWALRAGYAYVPTPLPPQTGRTNYIDNDVHQFGGGFGYTFADPLAVHDAPLTVDIVGQYTLMPDRHMAKSASDDAVGTYDAGGHVWRVALNIRHDFH
jgi:long-chain fatty acid transport protein